MKFAMAFAVVAIHSKTMTDGLVYSEWITWLISLAVPFFFIVSGFFTARRIASFEAPNDGKKYLSIHAKKSLRLYATWLIIYLPISVLYYIAKGEPLTICVLKYAYSIVLLGESPYAWTLWFIYSTFFFFFIARRLYYRNGGKTIMAVLFFGVYMLGFCTNAISTPANYLADLLKFRPLWGGNYIMIGMWLYRLMPRLKTGMKLGAIIMLSALSFTLAMAKLPFATQFGGIAVFMVALSLKFKCPQWVNVWLRMQSMLIYFCHMIILFGLTGLVLRTDYRISLTRAFVATSVLTLIFTCLIYPLFMRFKTFKALIS